MPLFDNDAEKLRKENLRILEDKRVAFAQELEKKGFKPERMFFCTCEEGRYVALARVNEKYAVVVSPLFGQEDNFVLDIMNEIKFEREEVFQKGEGLNGAFGFGKKGAKGFNLHISLSDGSVVKMPVVAGRTSWFEFKSARKNPLLQTKRRRGNANVMWDMMPIDPNHLPKIETMLADYYLA